MPKEKTTDSKRRVSKPPGKHSVHFYPLQDQLLGSLSEYIKTGLKADYTCIVIATPSTFISLNKSLRDTGADITAAMKSGQYVAYDVEELFKNFMKKGRPDLQSFLETVGSVISLAAGRGKPIRAFGEMVALPLDQENPEGVLDLEEYWKDLTAAQDFTLYCAYPQGSFDDNPTYKQLLTRICTCHAAGRKRLA